MLTHPKGIPLGCVPQPHSKLRNLLTQEMQEFLYAMRTPVPASPKELSQPSTWRRVASPFVVDIGANIGVLSSRAFARRGARYRAPPMVVSHTSSRAYCHWIIRLVHHQRGSGRWHSCSF